MNGWGTSRNPAPSSVSGNTAMRNCTGGCKRRRSVFQFVGSSTVCRICQRRAP